MNEIKGRVWCFPENMDTDLIVPGEYLDAPVKEIMRHAFESIRPDFPQNVAKGDIIVAGDNFGCGSSRENAASVLKELGVSCVLAESFGRIFFRNAIAIGLPALACNGISAIFKDGDTATVRVAEARVVNLSGGATAECEPLSKDMIRILEQGGILEYLKEVTLP